MPQNIIPLKFQFRNCIVVEAYMSPSLNLAGLCQNLLCILFFFRHQEVYCSTDNQDVVHF